MELTFRIELSQMPDGEWRARIYGGPVNKEWTTPLWMTPLRCNRGDALKCACRLLTDMHTDFLYAADLGTTVKPPRDNPLLSYAF